MVKTLQETMAYKKDLLKNKALSISLGINDIFNTDRNLTYTSTSFSEQENYRKRATRELRLNATWRFGKMDTHLFKRKNNKPKENDNGEMGGGDNFSTALFFVFGGFVSYFLCFDKVGINLPRL